MLVVVQNIVISILENGDRRRRRLHRVMQAAAAADALFTIVFH